MILPPRWRKRLKKACVTTLLLGVVTYCILLLLDALYPPDLSRYQNTSTIITDRNGKWLRVYLSNDDKRRIATQHAALSDDYLKLLINYEDRDFYNHNGIDVSAIFRALGQNISAQRTVSGASTVTMQAAKLLDPKPRTLGNKIIEAFRAWQLERRFSKEQILNIYTTLAPAGGNLEGLRAAAYYYLNKPIDKLSLGESAWLVALPQSPKRLSNNKAAAIVARDKVLKRALNNNTISMVRYQQAIAEPLSITKTPFPLIAPHMSNRIKWQYDNQKNVAKNNNATPTLHNNKISTNDVLISTLDKALQKGIEQTLASQLPQQHLNANLAAAILDNHSGKWLAYAGTAAFFDKKRQGQVDMLSAVRSPGSTLKPFISLFAFDWLNYQPQTTIDDTPINAVYQPSNYDGKYQGRITLSEALSRSRNVPAVRLLQKIQPAYFAQSMIHHGVHLRFPKGAKPNLSLALGGVGIRGDELTQLYRKLANCSFAQHEHQGKTLAEQKHCQQISQILHNSQDSQGRVFFGKEPVAFKTGTAYGWRDRWIFAYTKQYTIVIWNGRADGRFAEKRASAEALIPVLRNIIALLPNPPKINAISYIHNAQNKNLPPRLQHVGNREDNPKTAIKKSTIDANELRITAPLSNSIIDYKEGMQLSFHINGGTPPYLYIINDDIFANTADTSLYYPSPIAGNYHLMIIDAKGNSSESRFRLQAAEPKNKNKRAVWQ